MAGRTVAMYRIKDFAALLHIHPTHFSNTIKLTTRKSPCDHVEERIMLEANKLLDGLTCYLAAEHTGIGYCQRGCFYRKRQGYKRGS